MLSATRTWFLWNASIRSILSWYHLPFLTDWRPITIGICVCVCVYANCYQHNITLRKSPYTLGHTRTNTHWPRECAASNLNRKYAKVFVWSLRAPWRRCPNHVHRMRGPPSVWLSNWHLTGVCGLVNCIKVAILRQGLRSGELLLAAHPVPSTARTACR